MSKVRLTVTVDREHAAAGATAVAEGRAESVSAWVNQALAEKAAKDRRLASLAQFIADYEAEHGAITAEEMAEQERADRAAAATVRARAKQRRASA